MFKNRLLKWLLAPFFVFNTDTGGGGAVDRGDDFTPTDDNDGKAAAEALAAKEAADKAAKEAADKEAADKAAAEKAEADKAAADKEAADKEAAEKGDKKGKAIPLDRHESILKKERERREAAEAELAKTRKQEVAVQSDKFLQENETKLEGLETKYNAALVDGKSDEASKLMKEIRATERAIGDHKADLKANAAREEAIEAVRYDTIVDRIESEYPVMNPNAEEFDKATVAEVLEMRDAFQLQGKAPSVALQKAVKYVLGAASAKQKQAVDTTPRAKQDEVDAKLAEEKKAERAEAAAKAALAAAKGTPPSTAKAGTDSDKLGGGKLDAASVMKMSQQEFAKLDEKELARMRGDEL